MLQPTTKLSPWLYKSYFSPPLYSQVLPRRAITPRRRFIYHVLASERFPQYGFYTYIEYIGLVIIYHVHTNDYIHLYINTSIHISLHFEPIPYVCVQHILYRSVTLDVCTVDNGCTWRLIDIRQKCFLIPSRQIYLFSHDPIYIAKKGINYYDCLFTVVRTNHETHLPPSWHTSSSLGWC